MPDNESYWDLDNKEIKLNVNELRIQSKSVATMEDLGNLELQAWRSLLRSYQIFC